VRRPVQRPAPPRRVRAYLASERRFRAFQRLLNGVFVGAFLGIMDRDALAAVDAAYYDERREPVGGSSATYVEAAHMHSGFFDWEAVAVREHFPARGTVVVTAAGAGREIRAARGLGLEAVGYEPNPRLLAAGNALFEREGEPARLHPCRRDEFPALDAPPDAVIVGWTSYAHIPGRVRRVAFLSRARAQLRRGAPVLLSFWMRDETNRRYMEVVRRVAAAGRRVTAGEPAELGDLLAPLFVHCFTEPEIRAECEASGFECVAFHAEPYPHAIALAS
jgi:hypothetical protein